MGNAGQSKTLIRVLLDGSKEFSTPALAPGERKSHRATFTLPSGDHTGVAIADYRNNVIETNENNNLFYLNFSLECIK